MLIDEGLFKTAKKQWEMAIQWSLWMTMLFGFLTVVSIR